MNIMFPKKLFYISHVQLDGTGFIKLIPGVQKGLLSEVTVRCPEIGTGTNNL